MHKDRPSVTARRVAMSRAAHQLFDRPLVFDDPLAVRILGPDSGRDLQSRRAHFLTKLSLHLRAFLVARSRVAEDALAAAVMRGVRQYVILGAGLDTFAYRNPYSAAQLRVFEVDHPATQQWKRTQLGAAGIAHPASLSFVPIDFETEELGQELTAAGFDCNQCTLFSWLGVTMYLQRAAVTSTLSYIGEALPQGSGIVFDYIATVTDLAAPRRAAHRELAQRVARSGEPWKSRFEPRELAALLRKLRYAWLEDLGSDELNERYFAARKDQLRVAGSGRVMTARL
jgi:methyltransferase (TIGR00027 family)